MCDNPWCGTLLAHTLYTFRPGQASLQDGKQAAGHVRTSEQEWEDSMGLGRQGAHPSCVPRDGLVMMSQIECDMHVIAIHTGHTDCSHCLLACILYVETRREARHREEPVVLALSPDLSHGRSNLPG